MIGERCADFLLAKAINAEARVGQQLACPADSKTFPLRRQIWLLRDYRGTA